MEKLVIYCPLNKRLLKIAIKNNFHKYLICFDENEIFESYSKKVLNYLKRIPRDKLIEEGIRFWYGFLKARPTFYITDYNFYPSLVNYFYNKGVYNNKPRYYKLRDCCRYVALVYKNNKFYFIKTFCSLLEMDLYFNHKFKIKKKNYIIKYK